MSFQKIKCSRTPRIKFCKAVLGAVIPVTNPGSRTAGLAPELCLLVFRKHCKILISECN